MTVPDEKAARPRKDAADEADRLTTDELEGVSGGVFANKVIAETGPGAMSFPDVCGTPSPGAVPIPYPDSGSSSDSPTGSVKTKTGGQTGSSSGDVAG